MGADREAKQPPEGIRAHTRHKCLKILRKEEVHGQARINPKPQDERTHERKAYTQVTKVQMPL